MWLTNDFHGTRYYTGKSARVVERLALLPPEQLSESERRWVMRVRRALCGYSDCTCRQDQLGRRGRQPEEGE